MLFTVNTDINNYVTSIAHTKYDNIELDLEQIETKYFNAYKLVDDELILDENKKQELIAEDERIAKLLRIEELKQFLYSSDYILCRMLEDIMSLDKPLTFITDMIKIFFDYASKYKEQLEARKQARKEIEELEK